MADGTGTTLVLSPTSTLLSDITFDMSVTTGASSGYVVDAGSLRFKEHERFEVQYSEGARTDGGKVANARGPLVEVTFTVVISDATRSAMLLKAAALTEAVTDQDGGVLKYKPEDLAAGVEDTYYEYLQGAGPRLKDMKGNRWDKGPMENGIYRVILEVVLMTFPFPSSDPDTPVAVRTSDTVDNVDDGADDFSTVLASGMKGTIPALTRIELTPTGSQEIGRLWIAQRSEDLTSFESTYLSSASAAIAPTAVWGTETDASRCGGNYVLCTPRLNDEVYGRRFTISNWESHKGRCAVALVCMHKAFRREDWEVWLSWTISDVEVSLEHKMLKEGGQWEVLILGEIDLPQTEMGAQGDLTLYLDVYCKRTDGSYSTFGIDALKLLYTDEGCLDLVMPEGVGVSSSSKLVLETISREEIAQVQATADDALEYLPAAYGPFIYLKPNRTNRLDLIWERSKLAQVLDDFSEYADNWELLINAQPDQDSEVWAGGAFGSVEWYHPHIGDDSYEATSPAAGYMTVTGKTWSVEDWETTDYLVAFFYVDWTDVPSSLSMEIIAYSSDTDYYAGGGAVTIRTGFFAQVVAISSFSATGSPNWAQIEKWGLYVTAADTTDIEAWFGGLMVVKKGPGGSYSECTGDTFDQDPNDEWFILPISELSWPALPGVEYCIGRLNDSADDAGILWYNTSYDAGAFKMWAAVAVEDIDPSAVTERQYLLFWYCSSPVAIGSVSGYCVQITSTRQIDAYEMASGTPTSKGQELLVPLEEPGQYWLYVGVLEKDGTHRIFVSATKEDLFKRRNQVLTFSDSTYTGNYFGVGADSRIGYVADFGLAEIQDLHDPSDQLSLRADAVFQTITPFGE